LAAASDGQAVVGAVAVEADAEIIDELREGERDHDEIDPARTQRERAHEQREQRAHEESERPLHEARRHAFLRQDPDRIAANAEIDGMSETHHSAVAEYQVEAARRDAKDDDAREQGDQERVSGHKGVNRHDSEEEQQSGDHHVAWRERRDHLLDTGNRPSGRNTSTIAISR